MRRSAMEGMSKRARADSLDDSSGSEQPDDDDDDDEEEDDSDEYDTPQKKTAGKTTTRAMKDYLKPNLELGPSEVILHVGTNDLRSRDPKEVAESIIDLARQIKSSCEAKVTIPELVCRRDTLNEAVKSK
ncbi:hypothetical protein AC249_AIPGENE5488 [Exaiptasia diaphana]|nr:hypothetical protein AC249_AIPGENE5488 [Exaiptasia diaphana]